MDFASVARLEVTIRPPLRPVEEPGRVVAEMGIGSVFGRVDSCSVPTSKDPMDTSDSYTARCW
jgi:hypothetical protein